MDRDNPYYRQVQLLIRLLPLVARESCFALKGGTAINLFVREFPRLSVDIDLVYLPVGERAEALEAIAAALDRLAGDIERTLQGVRVSRRYADREDALGLIVGQDGASVKIELSPVLRGTVYEARSLPVVAAVEEEFGFAEVPVVAFEDLYAGKICAALDRQHPRDLFDVKLLLDNEGLTESLKKALLVYLISHPRPMEELLAPRFQALDGVYTGEFEGMTLIDVPLAELEAARTRLVDELIDVLNEDDKAFLCSVYEGVPAWSRLDLEGVNELPAVRWKLLNVSRMSEKKRAVALQRLREVLGS